MSTTYRIADVAHRSGFTAATLRYYEDIGLMAPAGRSEAGYRLYDDTSLARLRFIARAKQLGCTLDEVTELATAWDGGECGPVQERLLAAVEAKVAEAHARIAELTTFTADLQRAAATLRTHRPDGPCDDTCGCTSDTHTLGIPSAVPLVARTDASTDATISAVAESGAIACTLDAGEMATRLDDWNALLAGKGDLLQGVIARLPLDDGVRLEFSPNSDAAEIARLAAAEQGCCRFFRFALVIDDHGIALEVHAPPAATDIIAAAFGASSGGSNEASPVTAVASPVIRLRHRGHR